MCDDTGACKWPTPKPAGGPCLTKVGGAETPGICSADGKCLPLYGNYCSAAPPCTYGHYDANGQCIVDKINPGLACGLTNGCTVGICDQSGGCVTKWQPAGLPCAVTASDNGCTVAACDGKGGCATSIAVGNLCDPKLGACWMGTCDAKGACVAKPKPAKTVCGELAEPCWIGLCDGAGSCTPQVAVGRMLSGTSQQCTYVGCSEDGFAVSLPKATTLSTPQAYLLPGETCSATLCFPKPGPDQAGAATVIVAGLKTTKDGNCRATKVCTDANTLVDDPEALPKVSGTPCSTSCTSDIARCDGAGKCVSKTSTLGYCSEAGPCTKVASCDAMGQCAGAIALGASCPLPDWQSNGCVTGKCSAVGICTAVVLPAGTGCGAGDLGVKTAACTAAGACVATSYNVGAPCGPINACRSGKIGADGACLATFAPSGVGLPPGDVLLSKLAPAGICAQWVCDGMGGVKLAGLPGQVGAVCGTSGALCTELRCQANGSCAPQTATGAACQTPLLCTKGVCTASGSCTLLPDPTATCPSAGPCVTGTCTAFGVCAQLVKPAGTACMTKGSDGKCSAVGICVTPETVPGAVCTAGSGCSSAVEGILDANLHCTAAKSDGAKCALPCVANGNCSQGFCIGKALDSLCESAALCNIFAKCNATTLLPTEPTYGQCLWGPPSDPACTPGGKFCGTCKLSKIGGPNTCVVGKVLDVCDDGDPCTDKEVCFFGSCHQSALDVMCDDNDPCTSDWCEAIGCVHKNIDGAPCATAGAVCQAGKCLKKL